MHIFGKISAVVLLLGDIHLLDASLKQKENTCVEYLLLLTR